MRLTIAVLPDLNADLLAYADAYKAAYGDTVSVTDLIPEMLKGYLESDRDFAEARKSLGQLPTPDSDVGRAVSKSAEDRR